MGREEDERRVRRELHRMKRRKQERIRQLLTLGLLCISALIVAAAVLVLLRTLLWKEPVDPKTVSVPDNVTISLLTPNPYSRPQTPLEEVKGIVVHYVANPCTTAKENRNYFENLKDTHETKASSNFIVGLEGEIVQCVPTWEVAYASNSRNIDTVSIECCHPDESGKFTDATYESVVNLCAWLCLKFDLTEEDVIRHYDVTGKDCPKYFVEHEDAWKDFRQDVKEALAKQ